MLYYIAAALVLLGSPICRADTPANCTLDDVVGEWVFYLGPVSNNPNLDCTTLPDIKRKIQVTLTPDLAVENNWARGRWTMVYNQGFEVILSFRSFFSFFQWQKDGTKVTSFCNMTYSGVSHDITLRRYACFFAKKKDSEKTPAKVHKLPYENHPLLQARPASRHVHSDIVAEVNSKQSNWTAEIHEPFVNMTFHDFIKMSGGRKSWLPWRPSAISVPYDELDSLDWRNFNGTNFVSPVRNQGACGSCYAFSSAGMIESRIRLFTNMAQVPTISPQDIVSCTTLAQGCEGGFPFLIAGRYGWEKGLVEEACNPYAGVDELCPREVCPRWYTAMYSYVGGRYGRCNEMDMIMALRDGPISVSFNVYPDFMHYKSGIYHYTGVTPEYYKNFEPVNHAVLLVGFGTDNTTGEKYWIVKNSWGPEWGENGFFRIRRGADEVGIESIAVQAYPIPA